VRTWPPCFQVTPILNGALRTCMHACSPMIARRSNRAPFRPGMVSPLTTDLPAETTPIWAILGRHVNVREIFQNISRTNTPTERQESGPRALVSQSVQGHDHLSVNGVVDHSSDWKPSKHICVSSPRPPLPNHDVFGDLCRFSSSITFTCACRLDRALRGPPIAGDLLNNTILHCCVLGVLARVCFEGSRWSFSGRRDTPQKEYVYPPQVTRQKVKSRSDG